MDAGLQVILAKDSRIIQVRLESTQILAKSIFNVIRVGDLGLSL